MHGGYGVHHAVQGTEGGASLGLWLEVGRNRLLAVVGRDGVDAVGIGRYVRVRPAVTGRKEVFNVNNPGIELADCVCDFEKLLPDQLCLCA